MLQVAQCREKLATSVCLRCVSIYLPITLHKFVSEEAARAASGPVFYLSLIQQFIRHFSPSTFYTFFLLQPDLSILFQLFFFFFFYLPLSFSTSTFLSSPSVPISLCLLFCSFFGCFCSNPFFKNYY